MSVYRALAGEVLDAGPWRAIQELEFNCVKHQSQIAREMLSEVLFLRAGDRLVFFREVAAAVSDCTRMALIQTGY